ncbi:MAG TPA: ATP-binding cassette domain-containing protein [Desulfobacteraceae bacterium]|nr:ATP-binding cassette domain-containing protein [Desulfobacteraceae bacterium]
MINVEMLTKYYGNLCAVDQINFDVRKGEILGLLGPNGAGKTTTLRMLTGYIRPTSGTIHVKDYTIDEHPLEIKKLLGYLPESAPLYHDLLAYDYLDFVANVRELRGESKLKRIRKLTELCGLNEVMHKPIGELSKGYKQRVGLAHAMMNDPEILILDEPTSGLDPNQIAEIRDIIKQIGKEKTIIISTHILSEAEATCDRIIIINRGRIVADDSTGTLKQSAGGESLINMTFRNTDFPAVEKTLGSISGVSGIILVDDQGESLSVSISSQSSSDIRADIYRAVKETDWILLDFHQESRTLENIFRELTKEN